MSQIALILEKFRAKEKISQKELADRCRIPLSVVIDLEGGKDSNPDVIGCLSVGTGISKEILTFLASNKEDYDGWSRAVFEKLQPEMGKYLVDLFHSD